MVFSRGLCVVTQVHAVYGAIATHYQQQVASAVAQADVAARRAADLQRAIDVFLGHLTLVTGRTGSADAFVEDGGRFVLEKMTSMQAALVAGERATTALQRVCARFEAAFGLAAPDGSAVEKGIEQVKELVGQQEREVRHRGRRLKQQSAVMRGARVQRRKLEGRCGRLERDRARRGECEAQLSGASQQIRELVSRLDAAELAAEAGRKLQVAAASRIRELDIEVAKAKRDNMVLTEALASQARALQRVEAENADLAERAREQEGAMHSSWETVRRAVAASYERAMREAAAAGEAHCGDIERAMQQLKESEQRANSCREEASHLQRVVARLRAEAERREQEMLRQERLFDVEMKTHVAEVEAKYGERLANERTRLGCERRRLLEWICDEFSDFYQPGDSRDEASVCALLVRMHEYLRQLEEADSVAPCGPRA